jgi:hypothetical protein
MRNLPGAIADLELALRVAPPDWNQRAATEQQLHALRSAPPLP